jgi:putative glutamine amidotransferase
VAGPPPLIGLTGWRVPWELPCGPYPATIVETAFGDLVGAAGGLPVLLMPPAPVPDLLDRLDGLLVTGGPDVDPEVYGAARDPRTGPPDPERDALEVGLVREAIHRGMPVLAVCRGLQVVNVAHGGTLCQHVGSHAVYDRPGEAVHEVSLLPGTRLAQVLGRVLETDRVGVNSLHHQGIEVLGADLVASARAVDDDVIEAIEHVRAPLLGVQWHPEKQEDLKLADVLFQWLVDEAADRRATSSDTPRGS